MFIFILLSDSSFICSNIFPETPLITELTRTIDFYKYLSNLFLIVIGILATGSLIYNFYQTCKVEKFLENAKKDLQNFKELSNSKIMEMEIIFAFVNNYYHFSNLQISMSKEDRLLFAHKLFDLIINNKNHLENNNEENITLFISYIKFKLTHSYRNEQEENEWSLIKSNSIAVKIEKIKSIYSDPEIVNACDEYLTVISKKS